MSTPAALIRSCHIEPGVAVTVLVAALAVSLDASARTVVIMVVAVFSGQLVVGWTNDIVDRERDTAVGRTDKPLATGEVSVPTVWAAVAVAGVVCVVFSLLCGPGAGIVHIVVGLGSALAYNLGVKSTLASWVPYTVAFGSVPVVVALAVDRTPVVWMVAVGALLGFGAHLLNVLPDLDDDAATGVQGFPHRLNRRVVAPLAAVALVTGTVVAVIGREGLQTWWGAVVVATVVLLAVAVVRGGGKVPFFAAIAIAGVTVGALLIG